MGQQHRDVLMIRIVEQNLEGAVIVQSGQRIMHGIIRMLVPRNGLLQCRRISGCAMPRRFQVHQIRLKISRRQRLGEVIALHQITAHAL